MSSPAGNEKGSSPAALVFNANVALRTLISIAILLAVFNSFHAEMSYWYLAAAQNALANGNVSRAMQHVETARGWTPQAILPTAVEVRILGEDGQHEAALLTVTKGLAQEPGNHELQRSRLWLMVKLQREQEFIAQLAPVADLDRTGFQERLELSSLLIAMQKPELAIEVLSPLKHFALVRENQIPTVGALARWMLSDRRPLREQIAYSRLLLCEALRDAGRADDALDEAETAGKAEPGAFFEQTILALLLLQRREKVVEKLHRYELKVMADHGALDINTQNSHAYFRAVADRELDTALDYALAAVSQTRFRNSGYLDTLAYVLYLRGDFKQALEYMNQAIAGLQKQEEASIELQQRVLHQLSPPLAEENDARRRKQSAILHYHRAQMHHALEDKEAAEADLKIVTDLGYKPGPDLF